MQSPKAAGANKVIKSGRLEHSGPLHALPVAYGATVTMDEVAQEARVSRSTVSRALRNHPGIPPSTRKRIREVADRIGYRPNPFVAALMSQLKASHSEKVKSIIAMISAFPIRTGWQDNPSVTRMVEGALLEATKLGYSIETFSLQEAGMTESRISQILATRGIQGIIILPTPKSGASLELKWSEFSSVALGYSLAKPRLHRVCNHLAHTITEALNNITRLGHRKIGLAMKADTDDRVDHTWRSGYLLYQDMFPSIEFVPMHLSLDWNEESFAAWFRHHSPEVVVTDDMRVQDWLKHMRKQVPRDVGLVLLDCSRSRTSCAGIDQHHEIMGAAAVDLVVSQLHRNETGIPFHPKYVMIEGSWIPGSSLARAKPASRQRKASKSRNLIRTLYRRKRPQ